MLVSFSPGSILSNKVKEFEEVKEKNLFMFILELFITEKVETI